MCINPSEIILPNGRHQLVGCRKCRICMDNVVKDWTGRALAEKRCNKATFSVTLTYGRDENGVDRHERAAVLTYSDMQKYFKRVRKNVGPMRYLLAGEYGTLKGRAHWHGIFFFRQAVPQHKLFERFDDKLWPHGHQLWKKPEPSHVKYACKYIQKDAAQGHEQSKFVTSKEPPIGALYFVDRAMRMAAQRLPLNDLYYSFGEAKKKDGTPIKFYLKGATADLYRQSYITAWRLLHGRDDYLDTECVMEYVDRVHAREYEIRDAQALARELDEVRIWQERAKAGLPKYADALEDWYVGQRKGWQDWYKTIGASDGEQ